MPERAHDPERDAGARAHDHREQELPADVAEHGALHARRVVVLGRAVAARDDRAHRRADPLPVEQHVDREHDDQDQRDRALDHDRERLAREGHELARALGDALAERLQRGLALRGDLDVDPVVVEPAPGGRRARRSRRRRCPGRAPEPDAWSPIGSASTATSAASDDEQREVDAQHGESARDARALQHHDERVQQQGDERRDDEDQRDRAGRPQQQKAPRIASGRTTAWIQRGTTTGSAGGGGGAPRRSGAGGSPDAAPAAGRRPRPRRAVVRSCITRVCAAGGGALASAA